MPSHAEFLEQVWQRTPASKVRTGIRKAIELPQDTSIAIAAATLGNGSEVTAQDTVPFALWVAARHLGSYEKALWAAASHLGSYEEALWATVAGPGDRDTTCAIVGGIVVMSGGLGSTPKQWLKHREPIRHLLPVEEAVFGVRPPLRAAGCSPGRSSLASTPDPEGSHATVSKVTELLGILYVNFRRFVPLVPASRTLCLLIFAGWVSDSYRPLIEQLSNRSTH